MEKKYLKGQKRRNTFVLLHDSRKEDIQKFQIHEQKCFTASPQLQ